MAAGHCITHVLNSKWKFLEKRGYVVPVKLHYI